MVNLEGLNPCSWHRIWSSWHLSIAKSPNEGDDNFTPDVSRQAESFLEGILGGRFPYNAPLFGLSKTFKRLLSHIVNKHAHPNSLPSSKGMMEKDGLEDLPLKT